MGVRHWLAPAPWRPPVSGSPGIQTLSDSVTTARLNVLFFMQLKVCYDLAYPIPERLFLSRLRRPPAPSKAAAIEGCQGAGSGISWPNTKASGKGVATRCLAKPGYRYRLQVSVSHHFLTAETRSSSARPRVGEAASARAAYGEARGALRWCRWSEGWAQRVLPGLGPGILVASDILESPEITHKKTPR